ncbi:MAG: protein kinase [Chloroflexi bacterium]|nr:protein kinase [Chloroflexota bacterium]
MSPEQARGDKVDRKTDIYSLGVVLYEMVAGEVPFDAESSFGVLMKHLNDPPPPIAGISPDLQAVINRALAKDPAHRYDSAGDLIQDFVAVCSGQTISAETKAHLDEITQEAQKEQKAESRKTLRTAFITAGALLVIAAAGIFLFNFLSPGPAADPNKPVGRVTHLDFNGYLDKAAITTGDLPALKPGEHYEVWYLAQGGEIRRNIGRVAEGEGGGQLSFINPDAKNLLELFDQVEVTIEPDNDPHPEVSSGHIAASSVFPPLALVHVRHLLVSSDNAPRGSAARAGLVDDRG